MKISDLIKELKRLKDEHGDIRVVTQTLTHRWSPELTVRGEGDDKYILLNS